MLIGIDGKILHLKELDFIERVLFNEIMNPDRFYKDLAKYMQEENIGQKALITTAEIKSIDNFVEDYFLLLPDQFKIVMLRAYIVGRLLAISDIKATSFKIQQVSLLPETLKQAAREYGLSLQEIKAMQTVMENGASLLTNTTAETQLAVRKAVFEAIKRGEGTDGVLSRLQDTITTDLGELNRDWMKVAISEVNTAFADGYLAIQKEGDIVVGLSMPDACKTCLKLINGKIFKVRKEAPRDYSNLEGGEYEEVAAIWENEVWAGKNNFGRSAGEKKRLDPKKGNKADNLREKHHHENSMPAIPLHPHCFEGDVEILTSSGYVKFEDLKTIKNFMDKNKQFFFVYTRIKEGEYALRKPIAYIENEYWGHFIEIKVKEGKISSTSGHEYPIFRGGKEIIVVASDIRQGDFIILNSLEETKTKVLSVRDYVRKSKVYCVEVEDHTIAVKQGNFRLWTGNCRCRYVHINPKFQYVDSDNQIRLKIENPEEYQKWYELNKDKFK